MANCNLEQESGVRSRKGEALGRLMINFCPRLFSCKGEAFGQPIINFMKRLFSCKGEAFGQPIINFMKRLFSECFAPTSPVQESGVRIKT
ncbi:hypothetical protein [Sphaerospermopsis sp. FACHB-1194]|uniref:hypothetical protein n=1 Tax=Sphaerospermopsis sp. FACHB-1194 TaxID=2692862 RepID=UPI001680D8B5|nr:hypothetical protein [Sphaerospermopsis sp. FACHB-1194]MBD2145636.1 hypothetical protein [Sphaerospermopsis sp. FACHB-1194]